jgi:hypothetical protein
LWRPRTWLSKQREREREREREPFLTAGHPIPKTPFGYAPRPMYPSRLTHGPLHGPTPTSPPIYTQKFTTHQRVATSCARHSCSPLMSPFPPTHGHALFRPIFKLAPSPPHHHSPRSIRALAMRVKHSVLRRTRLLQPSRNYVACNALVCSNPPAIMWPATHSSVPTLPQYCGLRRTRLFHTVTLEQPTLNSLTLLLALCSAPPVMTGAALRGSALPRTPSRTQLA